MQEKLLAKVMSGEYIYMKMENLKVLLLVRILI